MMRRHNIAALAPVVDCLTLDAETLCELVVGDDFQPLFHLIDSKFFAAHHAAPVDLLAVYHLFVD